MVIGYTTGVYDLFHIGHLNLLKNAKGMCDKLIVGVTSDDLVSYKGKNSFIPFEDRLEIVRSCKYVDAVVPQYDMDKLKACKKLGATLLFVGDDWYETEKWNQYEKEFSKNGIKIVYFPYTKGISSTKIISALNNLRGWSTSESTNRIVNYIDKSFCMSSFLAFGYIEKDDVDFFQNLHHKTVKFPILDETNIISNSNEIDKKLATVFMDLSKKNSLRLGILLSGDIYSAILASYIPKGSDAYVFRFDKNKYSEEKLEIVMKIAEINELNIHYVDIIWNDIKSCIPKLMENKGAPVNPIEPQIYLAALQAKKDGIEKMVIGYAAEYVFYDTDWLLSQDWTFDNFYNKTIFIEPSEVLVSSSDIKYLYERYRKDENGIDYLAFYDKNIAEKNYGSCQNAFETAEIAFIDPYGNLKIPKPINLRCKKKKDSQYFIRELFLKKYSNVILPEKSSILSFIDNFFKDWQGPSRPEFKKNIDINKYDENQKWLLWCLEEFLNKYEPLNNNIINLKNADINVK